MTTDRVVFAQDLDRDRGLDEDGSKAFVKVDATTIDFDANGKLKALGTQTVAPVVTDGAKIATITINGTATDLFDKLTSLTKDGAAHSITYTNELLEEVTVSGADFLSNATGQSIIIAPDGGLFFAAVAQFPDDQVLTGDNTGSITFTLEPTTLNAGTGDEQVNYTIKGVIQLAPTTPSGAPNAATLDANNMLVVDPVDAQAGLTQVVNKTAATIDLVDAEGTVLSSVPLTKVENIDGTIKRGWIDLT